ncbi:hypothetical protein ACQ3I4_10685 [Zafaria sp. Z1313]|uniref:hypothetical protein n=1 Tax=unclassified Zafaria TaxID=2828765 RepID=UPI002E75CA3B|nr:hypothetical protein [Zafaria sp. J156]MEE1622213.1 hypothetical protein [Zafaria sp. J156]
MTPEPSHDPGKPSAPTPATRASAERRMAVPAWIVVSLALVVAAVFAFRPALGPWRSLGTVAVMLLLVGAAVVFTRRQSRLMDRHGLATAAGRPAGPYHWWAGLAFVLLVPFSVLFDPSDLAGMSVKFVVLGAGLCRACLKADRAWIRSAWDQATGPAARG